MWGEGSVLPPKGLRCFTWLLKVSLELSLKTFITAA
jgi:hypothetical protein